MIPLSLNNLRHQTCLQCMLGKCLRAVGGSSDRTTGWVSFRTWMNCSCSREADSQRGKAARHWAPPLTHIYSVRTGSCRRSCPVLSQDQSDSNWFYSHLQACCWCLFSFRTAQRFTDMCWLFQYKVTVLTESQRSESPTEKHKALICCWFI